MSLRSAFKAKFQSEKSKSEDTVVVDKDESKDTLSTEEQASASSNDSVLDTSTISQELYLSKLAELTDSLNDDGTHKDWTTSEREIYESQLSNLQEQLVASMIENQSLSEDLKKYKDTTEMDRLQQELEYEREKNKLLIEKFDQLERKPSSSGRVGLNELAEGRRPEDDVDSGIEIAADALHLPAPAEVEKVLTHKAKQYKILAWLVAMYYDFASDFTEDDEEEEMPQDKEGDPLTVKKGWHVTLNILPYSYVEEDNDSDKALGMSDKFQLVLQVARKVQNILGQIADGLEKVRK
uniref:Myosin-10-like n=1 Tax=Saccoglossus kowalevskii TaxID=10224 RepID=A0ABM0MYN2_SACKO|nr:PREDICTED: myosin-10-like [Saccoglossus kowalevskii]